MTAPAPAKAASTAARFSFGGGAPKCATCTKSVYANERTDYDGATFHIECFKCLKCKSRLTPRDVAKISGDIYCKPCFKKVFQEKGRYDSFGDKTVAKWSSADAARKSSAGSPPAAAASGATSPAVAPIAEEAKAAPAVEPTPAAVEPVVEPAAEPEAAAAAAEPVAEATPAPVEAEVSAPTEVSEEAAAPAPEAVAEAVPVAEEVVAAE